MSTIVSRFCKYLIDIKYANDKEKEQQFWDVEGVLKDKTNASYKYHVRETIHLDNNRIAKKGNTKIKADKMVFERPNDWVILDVEELHQYVTKQKYKIIELDKLLINLEWTIIIQK